MSRNDDGLPIEEFIHALTSQLDRAQAAMQAKVRAGLPLTFAVRDLSIDLRAHIVMRESQIRIIPAGPRDAQEASVIHMEVTTITRPMVEENTLRYQPDDEALEAVLGDEVTDEEKRRLEWAGIRTVAQLRDIERQGGNTLLQQVAQIPAMRLQAALMRISQPRVTDVLPQADGTMRIVGHNLLRESPPAVEIGGTPAPVLKSSNRELVVSRLNLPAQGHLRVQTAPGFAVAMEYDLDGAKAEAAEARDE